MESISNLPNCGQAGATFNSLGFSTCFLVTGIYAFGRTGHGQRGWLWRGLMVKRTCWLVLIDWWGISWCGDALLDCPRCRSWWRGNQRRGLGLGKCEREAELYIERISFYRCLGYWDEINDRFLDSLNQCLIVSSRRQIPWHQFQRVSSIQFQENYPRETFKVPEKLSMNSEAQRFQSSSCREGHDQKVQLSCIWEFKNDRQSIWWDLLRNQECRNWKRWTDKRRCEGFIIEMPDLLAMMLSPQK